jgi:hypothetical protein
MATTKSKPTVKLLPAGGLRLSWRRLLILASLTLNVGFIVIWVALASSYSLDGLFMADGLDRYCASQNDDKFGGTAAQVKALREYVCDRPDATKFFHDGFDKYLDSKHIPQTTKG